VRWRIRERMVVILDPEDYDPWLTCSVADAPKFFKQWMGQLNAGSAPLPPRTKKASPTAALPPIEPHKDPGLF
jgi:putative SOS response-associated peptidase YedK